MRLVAKAGQADRVTKLLTETPVDPGEAGAKVFRAVHQSVDDAHEFWLYEEWEDETASARHGRRPEFLEYFSGLQNLIEPESLLFGSTRAVKILGYVVEPEN